VDGREKCGSWREEHKGGRETKGEKKEEEGAKKEGKGLWLRLLPVSFSLFRVFDIGYSTMFYALQTVKKYLGVHSIHFEISRFGTVNRLVQVGKCLSKTIRQ
jgi:hypothetical protein